MSLALSAYVCVLCVHVLVLAYWHICMGVYILSNCTDVFLNTWRLSCIFHSLSFIVVALSNLCAIHSNFLFSFCAIFIVCHFVPKVQYWAYLGTTDVSEVFFATLFYSPMFFGFGPLSTLSLWINLFFSLHYVQTIHNWNYILQH